MATPALADSIRIETGTFENLDAVMEVMDEAFGARFGEAWTRSQLAGILPLTGVALALASEPDSPHTVGFSLFRTVADECELLLLAVRPRHHRQGVGRRLLDHFMAEARNGGVVRAHLEVRDGNPAVQMYLDAGFETAGRRRDYYHAPDGTRFDALTLARDL